MVTAVFQTNQVKKVQVRTGAVRTGQVRTGQIRTGQVKTGLIHGTRVWPCSVLLVLKDKRARVMELPAKCAEYF